MKPYAEKIEYRGYDVVLIDKGVWAVREPGLGEIMWRASTVGECLAAIDEVNDEMECDDPPVG